MSHYAKRTDATHREVCDALRACGWLVKETHQFPKFVDAVACKGDTVRLVEIKARKGKLTASQSKLVEQGFPVCVLRSADDAAQLQ